MYKNMLFLLISITLFVGVTVSAQVKLEGGFFGDRALLLQFPNTQIDSLDNVYSNEFTLAGFNYDFNSYPIYWSRLLASVSGKPRILNVLQGTNDMSNWVTVDTLSVDKDSTETLGTGTLNMNSKRFAWYRFKVSGTAANRKDTYAKFEIYLPYERK